MKDVAQSLAAGIFACFSLFQIIGRSADACTITPPEQCCALLESSHPNKTYSSTNQPALYRQSVNSYFSVIDRLTPTCIFAPANTDDVAAAVGLLSDASCQFAIKSVGHGVVKGTSNIVDGVTIDMRGMRSVSFNNQTRTASVQPGAKWVEVYRYLDPLGLAVAGGRAGDVGVGGFTSGGGISYFNARHGFACDNVNNFEVVLGTGEVVHANNLTNPDLYVALKGSQNNLGVITRFDFEAFELHNLWGGYALYNQETVPAQIEAFYDFTNNLVHDPSASLILAWTWLPANQTVVYANVYHYFGNVTDSMESYPPPFKGFSPDSPIGPPTSDTLRVANLSSLSGSQNDLAPTNNSDLYATLTFSNDLTVLRGFVEVLKRELDIYRAETFYQYASINFQPLPRIYTDRGLERGGNVFGLDRYEDNNVLFLLDIAWSDSQYDDRVRSIAGQVMSALTTYLESVGALKEYQYLNYAFQDQDPLGGYGPEALGKIRAASEKYDPGQVFQRLVPGGFKLGAAGSGNKYDH